MLALAAMLRVRVFAGIAAGFAACAASGCEPNTLIAVGHPGGVWAPDMGCAAREEGGAACPSGARFDFETPEPGFKITSTRLARDLRVSCKRSHCGTGALVYAATLRWPRSDANSNDRLTEIHHVFAEPVELIGKTLSVSVSVVPQNTPFNAQLAVISRGIFRALDDGAILRPGAWNTKGGVVGPDNPKWTGPANATSVMVSEIRIQVYLSTDVRNGSDTWNGEIWVDDVGWR